MANSYDYAGALTQANDLSNQINAGYQQRYDQGMQALSLLSDQQKRDLQQQYNNARSQATQGLINTGLYKTTILPSMNMGIQRQYDAAANNLNDQLTRERMGYQNQLSGDALAAQQQQLQRMPTQQDVWGSQYQQDQLAQQASQYQGDLSYRYAALAQQQALEQQRMAQQANQASLAASWNNSKSGSQSQSQYGPSPFVLGMPTSLSAIEAWKQGQSY